jgi:hypothetical protein
MKDIEILPNESGAPTVTLHGDAKIAAQNNGIQKVLVSLSHSEVRYMYRHSLPLILITHSLKTIAIAIAQASAS